MDIMAAFVAMADDSIASVYDLMISSPINGESLTAVRFLVKVLRKVSNGYWQTLKADYSYSDAALCLILFE